MMGRQVAQGTLFYGFRLDEHVPADHLLRRIDGLLDFGFVREALAASYSTSGQPSIDPELMLRMLLVGYLAALDTALPPDLNEPAPVDPVSIAPTDPQAALTCKHGPARYAYGSGLTSTLTCSGFRAVLIQSFRDGRNHCIKN
jgi:hypothetical protein